MISDQTNRQALPIGRRFFLHKNGRFAHTERMMKPTHSIDDVKAAIRGYYNCPVSVRVNLGRNKIVRFNGTLSGVYPALFTVSPDDKNFLGKTAYSYSEILCGSVCVRPIG